MNYDFASLSHSEFEDLVRDLVGREIGKRFEAFPEGPDDGIDGRHALADGTIILQAKHYYRSGFVALKSKMARERPSINRLQPRRYILVTSAPLTPKNKGVLGEIIGPALQTPGDIFGPGDLNALLRKYPDIEKAHQKLWAQSTSVLETVVTDAVGKALSKPGAIPAVLANLLPPTEAADEAGMIIAGHGRVLAARKLRIADVPVMMATGWTDAQKRAYAIADNKLTLNGGWDDELLGLELGELEVLGFDLDLIGFTEGEREILAAQFTEGLTDPDAVPDLPSEPIARTGDVWVLGQHRLVCGDSTSPEDTEKLLGGVKPHLMITDPPYGVNYDPAWRKRAGVNLNARKLGKVANDDRADWREAWALFPGSVAYVWHAGRHTSEVQQSLEASGFDMRSQIIWAKDRFALSRGHYHWQHEPCWYAVRGTAGTNWSGDRKQSTLWNINSRDDDGHGHGTQKPVECMRRPIENNSSPDRPCTSRSADPVPP